MTVVGDLSVSSQGAVVPPGTAHAGLSVSPGVIALLAALLAGWIAADAVQDLWHVGLTDAESSHILMVPVVFLWLFWVRRSRLRRCDGRGRWPGALLLLAGVALWSMGYRYQVQAFWHGGGVMMVAGAALTVLGSDAAWKFLPVWGSLLFLIPVPERIRYHIAGPLEQVTAQLTQSAAETLGMAVGRSGNQLSVNGVNVCVAEACNGMRLVFTLLLTSYVAMFYRPLRAWVRLAVLLATPVVAVAANVVRLVPTVWVFGRYPGPTAERFHDAAGWVMLLVAFGALSGACRLLEWVGLPVTDEPQRDRGATPESLAGMVGPLIPDTSNLVRESARESHASKLASV